MKNPGKAFDDYVSQVPDPDRQLPGSYVYNFETPDGEALSGHVISIDTAARKVRIRTNGLKESEHVYPAALPEEALPASTLGEAVHEDPAPPAAPPVTTEAVHEDPAPAPEPPTKSKSRR